MPKVKAIAQRKNCPPGFSDVQDKLLEFERKMREIENESHEGKRKNEAVWPIIRLNHERSRYIFNMYHKDKTISKELFDFLVKERFVDGALVSKWRKTGYEKLCCMQCIQQKDHNYGGTCICRVPAKDRPDPEKPIECPHCGCHGCCSGDS
jgi:bud site selection protein 31